MSIKNSIFNLHFEISNIILSCLEAILLNIQMSTFFLTPGISEDKLCSSSQVDFVKKKLSSAP